jgi:hypothetical protein
MSRFTRNFTFIFLMTMTLLLSCRRETPGSSGSGDTAFLKCAGGGHDGKREEIALPPLTLIRNGRDLEVKGPEVPVVVIGLLAGLNEPGTATLSNIRFLLEQFKGAGVQMILVAGGVGSSENDNRVILSALAAAPVPVLISPGAEENFKLLRKVIRELNSRHPQLIDMTMVRRVFLRHLAILSLPGYFKPFYLEAGASGCSYDNADLSLLASLIVKDRTNVLLSASPPRGRDGSAVDIGRGNVNIGDPDLARVLQKNGVRFGMFGHVHEAAGNATSSDGTGGLAPGIWHNSLLLQAGAGDAVPVTLVNGGQTAGIGHVVEFSGDRARYRRIAIP